MQPQLRVQVLTGLNDVAPADWDALTAADDPFVEHAFLLGLEQSGTVGDVASGWVPRHIVAYAGDHLVGALPLYEKYDSFGEFIFDWSWAQAAQRAGIAYYPKLVSAVPFTPVNGNRMLLAPENAGVDAATVQQALLAGVQHVFDSVNASSVHFLFVTQPEQQVLTAAGFLPRLSFQFHWERQPHWHTFADWLQALRAPARKSVRRERAAAQQHGLTLRMLEGHELTDADWHALHGFYQHTTHEKGGQTYLTPAFFAYMQSHLPHRVVAAMAHRGTQPIAGALFLRKGSALYGRYWGSFEPLDCMHFELCYYQPIEWGLQHGIARIEAGAQGEHKLKRGLMPRACYSAHAIRHHGLAQAVQDYLPTEAQQVALEMEHYTAHGPYPRG